jgi:hypothetical protein
MQTRVVTWLVRGVLSLGILVDGAMWFLGVEFVIAGLWLQAPGVRVAGQTLVFMMLMLHFVLGIWPMHWAIRLIDRLVVRTITPSIGVEKEK